MLKKKPKISLPSLSSKTEIFGKPHPLKDLVESKDELISLIQQMRREVNGLAPLKGISYSAELGTSLFFDTDEVLDFKISISSEADTGAMGFSRSIGTYAKQECLAQLQFTSSAISTTEIQNFCLEPEPRYFTALITMYKDGIIFKRITLYNAFVTEFKIDLNDQDIEVYQITIRPNHWTID